MVKGKKGEAQDLFFPDFPCTVHLAPSFSILGTLGNLAHYRHFL
jgi:hypothetical protein